MSILQIHCLRSFANAFLNGDEYGRQKKCVIGGVTRHRWSSQSQKFRLRQILKETLKDVPQTVRSSAIFSKRILAPLLEADCPDMFARHAASCVFFLTTHTAKKTRYRAKNTLQEIEKRQDESEKLTGRKHDATMPGPWRIATKRMHTLSEQEIAYTLEQARRIMVAGARYDDLAALYRKVVKLTQDKEYTRNLRKMGCGLMASLCGRIIPGDVEARVDSSLAIQHAFTVHEARDTVDYFSQFDELTQRNKLSRVPSIIFSGVLYQYANLDLNTLASNLSGDRELTRKVARVLVDAFTRIPAAAESRTAASKRAQVILLEHNEPRDAYTFAEAFETPCDATLPSALKALEEHVKRVQDMYDRDLSRAWISSLWKSEALEEVGFYPVPYKTLLESVEISLERRV